MARLRDSTGDRRRRAMMYVAGALAVAAAGACERSGPEQPPITPIAACPDGAVMDGAAPPQGLRQRCQKSDGVRHGATREWYEDRRERSYSEWWDGQKHGRFTLWFPSGRVRSAGAHRHGAPAGAWTYHGEDGTVQQHQTFSVAPPAADWLAQALAGHPPAAEEAAGASGRAPGASAANGW